MSFFLVRILGGEGGGYGIVDDAVDDTDHRAGVGYMQPPKT